MNSTKQILDTEAVQISDTEALRLNVIVGVMTRFNDVALKTLSDEGLLTAHHDFMTNDERRQLSKMEKTCAKAVQGQSIEKTLSCLRLQETFATIARRVRADDDVFLSLLPKDETYAKEDAVLLQKHGFSMLADLVYTKWQHKVDV